MSCPRWCPSIQGASTELRLEAGKYEAAAILRTQSNSRQFYGVLTLGDGGAYQIEITQRFLPRLAPLEAPQ